MTRAFFGITGICLFAVATGFNATNLRDVVSPPHPVAGLDVNDTSASASLLGQFRTSTSSWLWLRTDLYLHNGVEMRPLSSIEKQAGQKGVGSSEADLSKALDEDNIVTSVPSADRDFRGWLGDLERATAPYKDMHNHSHNNPEQSIPLFRLMTWIDPNFVEGWTTGSTVIARDRSENGTKKALSFLNEGLAANPESISILNEIAFMYITRNQDLNTAVTYLERARRSGLKHLKEIPEDQKDDFAEVYRWLGLCYRDLNEEDKMNAALAEGRKLFPDDTVLIILQHQPPLILNDYGRRVWNEQVAAKAVQEASRANDEAHGLH